MASQRSREGPDGRVGICARAARLELPLPRRVEGRLAHFVGRKQRAKCNRLRSAIALFEPRWHLVIGQELVATLLRAAEPCLMSFAHHGRVDTVQPDARTPARTGH
jgi:hypothetical protein